LFGTSPCAVVASSLRTAGPDISSFSTDSSIVWLIAQITTNWLVREVRIALDRLLALMSC